MKVDISVVEFTEQKKKYLEDLKEGVVVLSQKEYDAITRRRKSANATFTNFETFN